MDDGQYVVTKKGKRKIVEDELWGFEPVRTKWDKKWHFVLFDIPAKKERGRQALRAHLKELGYVKYQHSVFVHKYDMKEHVREFAEFYNIRTHLFFISSTEFDGRNALEKKF